jgi:hypothetical protein
MQLPQAAFHLVASGCDLELEIRTTAVHPGRATAYKHSTPGYTLRTALFRKY